MKKKSFVSPEVGFIELNTSELMQIINTSISDEETDEAAIGGVRPESPSDDVWDNNVWSDGEAF